MANMVCFCPRLKGGDMFVKSINIGKYIDRAREVMETEPERLHEVIEAMIEEKVRACVRRMIKDI